MYPWLLPGFNKTLSRIPREFWDLTPNHTNLVETDHAGTNRHTAINLRPLEAIQRARALDESTAASIAAANTTCIHRNPHNSEVDRAKRAVTRRTNNARRRAVHNDLDSNIDHVRDQISAAAHTQKELKAKLKDLNEKKKGVGRTPRHNRSRSRYDGIEIPTIRGLNTVSVGTQGK